MKRILSLLLALIMVFSLCCTVAFAEPADSENVADDGEPAVVDTPEESAEPQPADKLIYTALGASESNGYGLPEYDIVNGKTDTRIYKYGRVVDQAYPAMFAKAISADVFNQDCLAGLRSEDLLYLIDPSYKGDEYTHNQAFGEYVMKTDGIVYDGIQNVEQLRALYQKHVEEADVITLSIGLNNFGQYLKKQIERYQSGQAPYSMPLNSDAQNMLSSKMFTEIRKLLLKVMAVTKNPTGYVDIILRGLAYSYTDNLKSFDRIVDRIYAVNPDAEVYVIGLYNAIPELYLINGVGDIGQYNAKLMSSINDHYKSYVNAKASEGKAIYYVDVWTTETFGVPNNLIGTGFMDKLTEKNNRNAHPNYNGHIYIFDQLSAKAKENGWKLKDIWIDVPGEEGVHEVVIPFTDISSNDWFYEGVKYCYANDITRGTSETLFSPNVIVSRAQMATFIYRMAGKPTIENTNEPFNDVPASYWAHDAIAWAYNKGIIRGFSATSFAPDNPVTRGQAVTMLCRYTGPIINSISYAQFKDASSIPADFQSAISWAVDKGIIKGYDDGCFHSDYPLSRAQMVAIIERYSNG